MAWCFPGGHPEHALEPSGANVPGLHEPSQASSLEPRTLNLPGGHGPSQSDVVDSEPPYRPGLQRPEHVCDGEPPDPYRPGGHATQPLEPSVLYLPATQTRHSVRSSVVCVPALQAPSHAAVLPGTEPAWPGAHGPSHVAVGEPPREYRPTGQSLQLPLPSLLHLPGAQAFGQHTAVIAPTSPYRPAGQGPEQAAKIERPRPKRPAGQSMHPSSPGPALPLPKLMGGCPPSCGRYFPAGQSTHAATIHGGAFGTTLRNLPPAHHGVGAGVGGGVGGVGAGVGGVGAGVGAEVSAQLAIWARGAHCPAGQSAQDGLCALLLYLPLGHGEQTACTCMITDINVLALPRSACRCSTCGLCW